VGGIDGAAASAFFGAVFSLVRDLATSPVSLRCFATSAVAADAAVTTVEEAVPEEGILADAGFVGEEAPSLAFGEALRSAFM
jgi:hypothetical protein